MECTWNAFNFYVNVNAFILNISNLNGNALLFKRNYPNTEYIKSMCTD